MVETVRATLLRDAQSLECNPHGSRMRCEMETPDGETHLFDADYYSVSGDVQAEGGHTPDREDAIIDATLMDGQDCALEIKDTEDSFRTVHCDTRDHSHLERLPDVLG